MDNRIKVGLAIILVILIAVKFLNGSNMLGWLGGKKINNRDDLPSLHNKTIDNEHRDIADAIDNLHDVCMKHWQTEEKFFKMGMEQMPKDHKKIEGNIQEHTQQHQNFIDKIIQLKSDIKNHITHYDLRDLHWLQNK